MLVGYLGDIPFIVSGSFIRTFDEFGRNSTGRWAKHDIIGEKPVLEFIGPDVEKISFKMTLRRDKGINPEKELEKLRRLRDEGEVLPLLLNNRPVSDNFWIIESLDEAVSFWGPFGQMISASVTIGLQEYTEAFI